MKITYQNHRIIRCHHEHLEQLVLKSHVVIGLETDTSTEDVHQSASLLSKSIDDWGSWWSQGSLEHEAENAEHTVEVLEVLGSTAIAGVSLPLDTGHHLSNKDQVDDQRRCKKRVLADIEDTKHVSDSTPKEQDER